MILLPDDGSGDCPTQGIVHNMSLAAGNIAILPSILETNEDGVLTSLTAGEGEETLF